MQMAVEDSIGQMELLGISGMCPRESLTLIHQGNVGMRTRTHGKEGDDVWFPSLMIEIFGHTVFLF